MIEIQHFLASILIALLGFIGVTPAQEPTLGATPPITVPAGGTGWGNIQAGTLIYGTGNSLRVGTTSTTTLTTSGALSFSQPVTILGSASSALTLDTSGSWTGNAGTATALAGNGANCSSGLAPLGVDASGAVESCFDVWTEAENTSAGYVQNTRTLTVAGTANQVSSSAGAQDLSANRTWTLSLPNHVIFPNSFFSTFASTTHATSTNFSASAIYAISTAGLDFHSSNGTHVAEFGQGGGSNVTFSGGVNIDGATRLATSLTGLLKATAGAITTATAGTDYENPLTFSFPLIRSTNAISFGGLSTTSPWTTSGLSYVVNGNTLASVATTTVSCSGNTTCTSFTAIGGAPITISSTGGGFDPFTHVTNFGTTTAATSTPLWLRGNAFSLFASSTAVFQNASTTLLSTNSLLAPSNLTINAGNSTGSITIEGGDIQFFGSGSYKFWSGSGTFDAFFDATKILADRVFTFPDVTGTLGVGTATTTSSLAYWQAGGSLGAVPTTTASCAGTVSCTSFTVLGGAPITITGSGVTSNPFEIATTTDIAISGLAFFNRTTGRTTLASVATTSFSSGSGLTLTGTLGALVGGSNSSLAVNDRDDIATTTDIALSQLAYYSKLGGLTTLAGVSTTTLVAGTNISFSGGTPVILGSSAITINATGGGGGGDFLYFATSTVAGQRLLYTQNATTTDVLFGNTATTSAPFWWDISATTTYIGTGGAGSSTSQYGRSGYEWLMGYDGSDNAFKISSSTVDLGLTVNNVLSIAKTTLLTTFNYAVTFLGNIIATANVDFGGATFLEIPNGANPTADDPGEIAHDTTDNQLILDDAVIPTRNVAIWSVTIASTSPAFIEAGLVKIPTKLDGYTMTAIRCSVQNGTSKIIAVEDESTNSTEDITCLTSVTSDDGTITNASVTAGEEMYIDLGATSGAVDYVSISVFGDYVRE